MASIGVPTIELQSLLRLLCKANGLRGSDLWEDPSPIDVFGNSLIVSFKWSGNALAHRSVHDCDVQSAALAMLESQADRVTALGPAALADFVDGDDARRLEIARSLECRFLLSFLETFFNLIELERT